MDIEKYPQTHIIGLSFHVEGEISQALYEAGASGYVNKGNTSENLIQAIYTLYTPPNA